MAQGIVDQKAPELRVPTWIDGDGERRAPLRLSELGNGYKVLYCFQHWCPGCHASGFPTLQRLTSAKRADFGFAVVQTVFEGEQSNTFERLAETQARYRLSLPFGHDPAPSRGGRPTVMEDYRTGGTPWFIIIAPGGEVAFNGFQLDADQLLRLTDPGNTAAPPPASASGRPS